MAGIISYGYYVPYNRITVAEIARRWGKNPADIENSLNIKEKAVAGVDEDALTMAYEASTQALSDVKINKDDINAVFFGSETPPYAVNPASTILAEFLGIEKRYLAYDTQFACKAATGAVISGLSLIQSGFAKYSLVCGSDKANSKPHDALEYTAASGAVSFLLGNDDIILEVVDMDSFSSDTPDFWRREGMRYPIHGGRFTGKPSYFHHIKQSATAILEKNKMKPEDFAHAVFHMPNGRFPIEIAAQLGFTKSQIETSLVVRLLGNSYTASALMGLVSVLEKAKPDDYIFFASYGSGAGSDSFIFKVTKNIEKRRRSFEKNIAKKSYIDYPTYLKYMGFI